MARKETDFKATLIRYGKAHNIEIVRHEDRHRAGIPDLSYSCQNGARGWIETKMGQWDEDKFLNLHHLRDDQVKFLKRHGELAGLCFVAIERSNRDVLFVHWTQLDRIGTATPLRQYQHVWLFEHRHKLAGLATLLANVVRGVRL